MIFDIFPPQKIRQTKVIVGKDNSSWKIRLPQVLTFKEFNYKQLMCISDVYALTRICTFICSCVSSMI